MGYSKQALSGFTGQTVLKIIASGLAVIRLAILARLLAPDDFGLFSLTMIALGVSEAVTQTGVNITILQSKQSIEYFVDTAWVIAIVRGFIISVVMILLGFGLSRYFNQPLLVFLITWVSLVPLIKGFINPAIVGLQKNLTFVADTVYRVSLLLVETLAAIGLVFVFRSVFAWLSALVISALFEVVISFVFLKVRPRFAYKAGRAKTILENAKHFGVQSLLSYLTENMDNLIVGKTNGTYALGLYQPTYSLSHQLNYEIAKSVHHGALPVYTKISDNKQRLKRAFLKASIATAGLALVASIPFFVAPSLIINLIFGSKWSGAVELLPWLVVAGWLQAVSMTGQSVLLAKNRLGSMNLHLAVALILMVGLMVVFGTRWGVLGAVMGLALSRALAMPVLGWFVSKELRS